MYPMFKKDMSLLFLTVGSISLDASERAEKEGNAEKAKALKEADAACTERSEDLLIEYWQEELAREAQKTADETPH